MNRKQLIVGWECSWWWLSPPSCSSEVGLQTPIVWLHHAIDWGWRQLWGCNKARARAREGQDQLQRWHQWYSYRDRI